MRLRYAGVCRACGATLDAGVTAVYDRATKAVRCDVCPGDSAEVDDGAAGASARREHLRRVERREQRIRAKHPKLGALILALSEEPQSTRAWESGGLGEERVAKALEAMPEGRRVLHDRRIPGTRANIDHIVVSPAGVWVVDAKRYRGQRPSLQIDGGIFRPRVEQLRVGGRLRTNLVHGVRKQVELVTEALGGEVPVNGALCFVDADWPLFGGTFSVDDILVCWPTYLVGRLGGGPDADVDVPTVHARLANHFPTA